MPDVAVTIAIVFVTTAVFAGSLAALVLNRQTDARRRLDRIMAPPKDRPAAAAALKHLTLTDTVGPTLSRVSKVLPTSTKEMSRIRRRLVRAGFTSPSAPVIYAASEVVLPVVE
jgi:ABC-type spermidine/putrescine transport system permease subunit II